MLSVNKVISLIALIAFISTSANAETLADIYQLAVKNDPIAGAAKATYKANKETLKQGRAVLLPQLNASSSKVEPTSNENIDPISTTYRASLSQSLFNVPAWFQFRSAKNMDQAAEAKFASQQQSLIIRVSESYFNVLRAYDNKQTRQAEELAIQRQLEQVTERFEVGLLPITDVHEIQAIFDDASVNSLEANGALDIAFDKLQILSGKNHNQLAGLKDSFTAEAPNPISVESWVEFALANNLELRESQLTHQAANETAKAAKFQHLPKVTISADYSKRDTGATASEGALLSEQTAINLNLTMPLFSGGLTSSQARQSSYQAQAAEQNYIAIKRNTMQSARSNHQLAMTNAARVKARKQAITSAESALKATQAGYEVGTRNIVDVLLAQRTLFQAKRNSSNARYDYILSMMRLKQVAGQLSPEDVFELNDWLNQNISINRLD
ncbi:MAG: TolC family outer membrane protein [Porticoccaceae bacterium]